MSLIYISFLSNLFFKNNSITTKITIITFVVIYSLIILIILPIKDAIANDPLLFTSFILGIIAIIITSIFMQLIPKRTPYGNEMLGKIKGFRNFLVTAEKEELEELVMKNPTYFYDILPYTYVLGVSSKWIKKFESIAYQSPDWYSGSTDFDLNTFEDFINSTMTSAASSMTYNSSSSDGGGSSGGGSGGGGGGSW